MLKSITSRSLHLPHRYLIQLAHILPSRCAASFTGTFLHSSRVISTHTLVTVRSMSSTSSHIDSSVGSRLSSKLRDAFTPVHLEVINESHMHSRGVDTHFKVVIVSAAFDGQALLARHRAVNTCLADDLRGGVHALTIVARTPAQWEADASVAKSPSCMGGSKHDRN